MKVHITLVGGQPAPVYHGIVAVQPDKVVYIYSDESRGIAERIATEVNILSERRKMNPVDLEEIERKVLLCASQFKDDEVSINISSGTKPWAFYFAKIFGAMSNATLFYVDQNNTLWNFSDKSSCKMEFDMDAQFRLLGNPLEQYVCFKDYDSCDNQTFADIQSLFGFAPTIMFHLVKEARTKTHLTEHVLKSGSYIRWIPSTKQFEIKIVKENGSMKKVLKSKHVRDMLLKCSWFEYMVADILRKWDKAGEIRMNCVFPYKDSAAKNEIDVLVETGSKLLFVECKTQIEDNTDIDKFASAVRNYGGLGSKALFVTYVPMTEKAKEKCNDNGIMTYSFLSNHMELDNEKLLTMLLDNELFNINTK